MNTRMRDRMRDGVGFIAALDQSGGSTPKALSLYGIGEDSYTTDAEMFDLVHQMRTRIITDDAFTGDAILGAILFEQTMDREIDGLPTADFLWQKKNIVPFLKIDQGLADEADGVQLMKPMPDLDDLLERAVAKNIFGTKERSVIRALHPAGIAAAVAQQFEIGKRVLAAGLMPILEPEVDIHAADRGATEAELKKQILAQLADLPDDQQIMLKLSIPEIDGFYSQLINHPKVLRVVALSGGFTRDEANSRLARNPGLIASFSRALSEGLHADQTPDQFHSTLTVSCAAILEASRC